MARGIFVLGNGFDLDLGLETSFTDFAKSPYWTALMEGSSHSLDKDYLLGFLKSKYDLEKWIDIEASLLQYAIKKTRLNDFNHSDEDKADFISVRQALKEYLSFEQNNFVPKERSVAAILLRRLGALQQSKIYTFNYTEPEMLAVQCGFHMSHHVDHIHGALTDSGELILGIETDLEIDDRYAFLFKTQNRKYQHTNILNDLSDRDEYVFFGHALNGMDYGYFRTMYSLLSTSSLKVPHLTIITKDEDAEDAFKVFLRHQRISLQHLYSHSTPTFILTQEIYNGNEEERIKLVELLERMKGM